MKHSFSNIAWGAPSDDAALRVLAEEGYGAVEVAPTRLWPDPLDRSPDEVEAVRAAFERAGFQVVAMQSLLFQQPDLQVFGDPDSSTRLQQHLLGMVRLGAALGATRLVFGSPGNRRRGEIPLGEAMERAVEVLRPVGLRAADLGVALCIEANPTDYGCDFLTSAVESTAFVRAADTAGIRLHLDAACMALAGDDAAERVREGIDVLAHVHASAPQLGPVGPGGPVDHDVFAAALSRHGYDGYVSVEMRAQPEEIVQVRESARFVRSTYT